MNSSANSHNNGTSTECEVVIFLGGRLGPTATFAYVLLLFIMIMNIITCPITAVLNALVMLAVRTKPRLKTKPNIALGCLATTDWIMGAIGQPLFIAEISLILRGETSSTNCWEIQLSKHILRVLGTASLIHVALMNVERYIAIKQALAYITTATGSRILRLSALAWITALILTVPVAIMDNNIYLTVSNITLSSCMVITIYCQVVIYFETRRHEKQMAAHQVSVETKEKFLKEKKAFKVTTTVVLILVLNYAPIIVVRILIVKSVIDSVNAAYICFFITSSVAILNSLINPIIYCVRIRHFRVAFIEIVLRKNNAQAEEFEMQIFGLNAVAPLEQEH